MTPIDAPRGISISFPSILFASERRVLLRLSVNFLISSSPEREVEKATNSSPPILPTMSSGPRNPLISIAKLISILSPAA